MDGYGKALELAREFPECEVFSISDREGDVFEVYQAWLDAEGGSRAEWIIRANQDRALVNVPAGDPAILFAALRNAPVLGGIEFEIRARKGTKKEARRIIDLYMRRWDIEVFHRVLKTGCRVESIQLKTGRAVIHALMIYAVIAWRILYLTHLGRQCPDLPCGCVFEEAEWKSACAVVKRKKDAGEPSLSEFIGIIGKLGGHLGRKSDGAPGPQSIWQGLARIRDFACAWHAFYGE